MNTFDTDLRTALADHNAGRQAEAESLCRRLIAVAPTHGDLCYLLGRVLHKTARHTEALEWLHQAAESLPESAPIFTGLGLAYSALKDYPRAIENFTKSLQLDPGNADTEYSIGNACYHAGDTEAAVIHFTRAVELNPRDHGSWNNLGKTLKDLNRLEESIAAFDQAIAIQPDSVLAHCNRSISLLTAGRLEEGFREYEWRWRTLTPRHFPQPVWQGEPLAGKTLLLLAEQGLGDTIHFARYIRQVRERGARVLLECRAPLKRLFESSGNTDAVIAYGDPLPPFDYHIPLMSLPGSFQTRMETIPSEVPYLKVPSGAAVPNSGLNHRKVGLVWAGNPEHHDDRNRSLRFEQLAPILAIPGITFYNFQTPMPSSDEAAARAVTNLVQLSGRLDDFLTTATALDQMDLVITVDTAVAHLAGALGKPVWTLIPYAPDWRWFLNRTDTPWYPTMRLFRQRAKGDWQTPIIEIASALAKGTPIEGGKL